MDRYTNVGIAGLNYTMFVVPHPDGGPKAPFQLNCHVYSCTLFLNSLPYKWRGRYNEDTDICLQVLSGGWCTILMNAFMIDKQRTMTMKGGNSDLLYTGDGRLKMARELQRRWRANCNAQDLPTAMSEAGNSGWVATAKRAYCPTHNWLIIGGEPVSCLFSSDLPPYVQAVQGEVPDA